MLLQAGIRKIYYLRNYHNDPYAVSLLERKDVAVQRVEIDKKYLNAIYTDDHFNEQES